MLMLIRCLHLFWNANATDGRHMKTRHARISPTGFSQSATSTFMIFLAGRSEHDDFDVFFVFLFFTKKTLKTYFFQATQKTISQGV